MNEGDFDKLFNDKFKDFEGSDFSPTEWGGLENRLNKRDNWRKILLWLLPLLLLSALAGGWFYTWYQLQQMRMNVPDSSFIDNTRSHKDTLQDTIIRRTIIYQNDTIYRKILLIDQQYFSKPNPLGTNGCICSGLSLRTIKISHKYSACTCAGKSWRTNHGRSAPLSIRARSGFAQTFAGCRARTGSFRR